MTGRCGSWELARRSLPLDRPLVMGILNVTPDSFSDGNRYFSLEAAVARGLELEAQGADILDVGGESTRPGAPKVPLEEELRRVVPVVEALAGRLSIPISVDTYKAGVARAACAAGAEIVNDVSGLDFDPGMAAVVAHADAGVVLMHTRGTPETMQADTGYCDLVAEVKGYLARAIAKAEAAGIKRQRVAVDPGIGFGKSVEGNRELVLRLGEFREFGCPVLIGPSRKSFIGALIGKGEDARLFGTAAVVAIAVANGADIVRVHDVAAMRAVAVMARALC